MLYRLMNVLMDRETKQEYLVTGTPRDHYMADLTPAYALRDGQGNTYSVPRNEVESERYVLTKS